MAATVKPVRTYRTSIKRGQARSVILDAARRLFAEQGYLATSIEDIAKQATVARPTVFTAVGNKPALLKEVISIAISGSDDAMIKIVDRPWFRKVIDEPDPRRMLQLQASNIRMTGERVSDLYHAAEAAAGSDTAVDELFRQLENERLAAVRLIAHALASKTTLRNGYDEDAVTDVLYAVISPLVYRSLVRTRQWPPARFESWAADLLIRQLLPD